MALLIKADGIEQEVQPDDGMQFSYNALKDYVGGLIEHITLTDGGVMTINEEGMLLNLPINLKASKIARPALSGWLEVDGIIPMIAGDVLITSPVEVGM